MTRCIICEKHPARDNGFCHNCGQKIQAEATRKANSEPKHFVTYRGMVIGLYPNGGGKLIPRLLKRDPEKLPRSKTINLDRYCPGFERLTIKRLKSAVIRCCGGMIK